MLQIRHQSRVFSIVLVTLFLFLFQAAASWTGRLIAGLLSYETIDGSQTFAWITVHHLVQLALACGAILCCKGLLHLNFGFRLGNRRLGLRYVLLFTGIYALYAGSTYLIGGVMGTITPYSYPLTIENVLGTLGFQLFLSGPSEEVLFRALPVTLLACVIYPERCIRQRRKLLSPEVIIAAVLFSLAHIQWSVQPFAISFDWIQLLTALLLGAVYGVAYQRTGSLLYPMLMHSMSNVLMLGGGYLFAAFRG